MLWTPLQFQLLKISCARSGPTPDRFSCSRLSSGSSFLKVALLCLQSLAPGSAQSPAHALEPNLEPEQSLELEQSSIFALSSPFFLWPSVKPLPTQSWSSEPRSREARARAGVTASVLNKWLRVPAMACSWSYLQLQFLKIVPAPPQHPAHVPMNLNMMIFFEYCSFFLKHPGSQVIKTKWYIIEQGRANHQNDDSDHGLWGKNWSASRTTRIVYEKMIRITYYESAQEHDLDKFLRIGFQIIFFYFVLW